MTRVQKIQLKLSEARTKLAALLDTETEKRSETFSADLDTSKAEIASLESEFQAAMIVEPEPKETRSEETPEKREFRELLAGASVEDFIREAIGGVALAGASKELREETLDGLATGWIPLDLFMTEEARADDSDDLEERADAATNVASAVQDTQRPITPRLFPQSSGAYMGIERPTVPVGDTTYVTLASGATGDFRSDGVAKDAEAAGFVTKTVSPVRLTSRYLFGVESRCAIEASRKP